MAWSKNLDIERPISEEESINVSEQLIKDTCTIAKIKSKERNISNSYQNDEYPLQQLLNKIDDKDTLANIKEIIKITTTNDNKYNSYLNKIDKINNEIQAKLNIAYKIMNKKEFEEQIKPLQDSYEFFFWTNELDGGIKDADESMYQSFQKFDTKITQLLLQKLSANQLAEYLTTEYKIKGPHL